MINVGDVSPADEWPPVAKGAPEAGAKLERERERASERDWGSSYTASSDYAP